MIIAWTAFVFMLVVTLSLLTAWGVMARALFVDREAEYAASFFGFLLLTGTSAVITAAVAEHIWGGAL